MGLSGLRDLPAATLARAVPIAALAAVLIGIPSDLVPNPVFGRPVPVRTIDYVILTITAALIGLILAIRVDDPDRGDVQQTRALWGGFVSFLAVGCPVCNQLVVALVGASGAMSWWAPVQPVVGAAAIALLAVALRQRLSTYRLTACPLPARSG
jgi:hypothetical protein